MTETSTTDTPTLEGRSPVQAPQFYVSQFQAMVTPTEAVIVCGQGHPFATPEGRADVLAVQPAVVMRLAPLSAKELMFVLKEAVANYEREYGVVNSAFTLEAAGK